MTKMLVIDAAKHNKWVNMTWQKEQFLVSPNDQNTYGLIQGLWNFQENPNLMHNLYLLEHLKLLYSLRIRFLLEIDQDVDSS